MELNLKMLQAEQAEAGILKDLIQKLQTDLQAYPESLAAESIKELLTLYREKYTRLTKTLNTAEAAFSALPAESESLLRMRYQDGLTCEQVCDRLYIAATGSNLAGNGSTLQADKEIGETSNCPVVDREQA